MSNHYIYAFLEPATEVPRYIGQGVGSRWRWWRHPDREAQYGVHPWLRELKQEPTVIKIATGLSQKQADNYEEDLIEFIGRVSEGTGPLLNIAAGPSTCGHSLGTRRRRSKSNRAAATKGDKKGKSKYYGVSPHGIGWGAAIQVLGKNWPLSTYREEIEAAYAYDLGILILCNGVGRLNDVGNLLNDATKRRIEKRVRRNLNPEKRLWGTYLSAGRWRAAINMNGVDYPLGIYGHHDKSQIEAAYAYNCGAQLLRDGKGRKNSVEHLLDSSVKKTIKQRVQRKICERRVALGLHDAKENSTESDLTSPKRLL